MPYDDARLRGYAKHVAEARRATPPTVLIIREEKTSVIKRWFGSRAETGKTTGTASADGWILLRDRTEGLVALVNEPNPGPYIYGTEEGRLLLLSLDGELLISDYRISMCTPLAGRVEAWQNHQLSHTRLTTADDVKSFDRLNRAEYREVRMNNRGRRQLPAPGRGNGWQRELGRNWQVRVREEGLETRRALTNFKRQGSYVDRLAISY